MQTIDGFKAFSIAVAFIPEFSADCCDPAQLNCCDPTTLTVDIREWAIYVPKDNPLAEPH